MHLHDYFVGVWIELWKIAMLEMSGNAVGDKLKGSHDWAHRELIMMRQSSSNTTTRSGVGSALA